MLNAINKISILEKNYTSITNDVYYVIYKNKNAYYKIYNSKNKILTCRNNEFYIWHLSSKYNISPKILKFKKDNFIISEEFKANMFDKNNSSDEEIIQIIRLLKQLHSLKINKKIEYFDPIGKLKIYSKNETISVNQLNIINEVSNYLSEFDEYVICHNDLIGGNILIDKNKKVNLIDFEFSGLNDKYFDLASFISENKLNKNQINLIIKTYFNENKFNKDILNMWIKFNDLLWYFWAKESFKLTSNNKYLKISKIKLKKINFKQ